MSEMVQREQLLSVMTQTPLGRVILAGEIQNGRGVQTRERWRTYGSYAVVAITRGTGTYKDRNGVEESVGAGDVIFVFPDLPHRYGPTRGQYWDELYLTFDGPLFDLWREQGLLTPALPLWKGDPRGPTWTEKLRCWIQERSAQHTALERVRDLHTLLELLAEPLQAQALQTPTRREDWLGQACARLETNLGEELSLSVVAQECGMGYETFRKRFQQAVGVSPARYRMGCRIAMAQQLLRFSPQRTNQQIAESLGFADAFHFSRRFTEVTGRTPQGYRREAQKKPPTA